MKGRNSFHWYGIAFLAFSLAACQVKRPDGVMPDAKMEKVLYDYHIAKAMGEDIPYNESYKRLLYIESVFKKYGITQADFDSSMVWYTRNPEVLAKVYEKVNLRLKSERNGINHLIALRDDKPEESLPGDSIDVWFGSKIYRLTGMPLNNKLTFSLPSDTNFYNRDTLRWSVRFHFNKHIPDSLHAPLMAMQVLYEKDSIVSDMKKVYQNGFETLSVSADTLGKIKEVRGFIYYPKQESPQVLLASGVSLMRYHAKDSLAVSLKDSVLQDTTFVKKEKVEKPESVKPKQPEREMNPPHHRQVRPRPNAQDVGKPMIRKAERD